MTGGDNEPLYGDRFAPVTSSIGFSGRRWRKSAKRCGTGASPSRLGATAGYLGENDFPVGAVDSGSAVTIASGTGRLALANGG